jgi:hypothetical protein
MRPGYVEALSPYIVVMVMEEVWSLVSGEGLGGKCLKNSRNVITFESGCNAGNMLKARVLSLAGDRIILLFLVMQGPGG